MPRDRLVLITGATGYVGTVLAPLVAEIYPVVAFDSENFGNAIAGSPNITFLKGDVRDSLAVARALEGVTDVIALAAIVTDNLVALNESLGRKVNNDALHTLANLAAERGVSRLIYASSSSVYGSQLEVATEQHTPQPQTEYAWTKLRGEHIVNAFRDRMTVVSVRSATACGPAPRFRADTIINTFAGQAYFQERITVHGGEQYRTNINILDLADLYRFLLDAPPERINGEVFNAAYSNNTALELARMVQAVMGGKIVVETDKWDPRSYRMDAGKLRATLGWGPRRTLRDAVCDLREFFDQGLVPNWQDPIYRNDQRMREYVLKEDR